MTKTSRATPGVVSTLYQKLAGVREMMAFDNGILLALDRLLYPRARLAVYRHGNIEVAVDRAGGDIASVRACLATPMYRRLLRQVQLPARITVLDVGAHVGGFSLLLLAMGHELDRLVAVELNPNTALRLRHNLAANLHDKPTRLTVRNVGVWPSASSLRRRFGWGSTGDDVDAQAEGGPEQDVPLVPLDEFIEAEFGDAIIDVCKIDIEGAEHRVLSTLPRRLAQLRYLVIEIHRRQDEFAIDVRRTLWDAGFRLVAEHAGYADAVCLFANDRLAAQQDASD